MCASNICGSDLINSANAENFIETISYLLLITKIHNNSLDSDFYILSTIDRVTNKTLDKILLKRNSKQVEPNGSIFYTNGNLELNEEDPSKFEISYSEEKNISSILEPDMPVIQMKDTKTENYTINLAGRFTKNKLIESTRDFMIVNSSLKNNKLQKYVLLKNEILAKYKFNFGDVKINNYFISKIPGYAPLYKQEKVFLSENDKNIIKLIEDKISSFPVQEKKPTTVTKPKLPRKAS
ncbi:MAG: hypothetical protein ACEQSF_00615 [Solirubrobacteraceae bacterium]